MRKRFLLFAYALTILSSKAQDVYIPDASFKNHLLTSTTVDISQDGEIQVSEAEAYTGALFMDALGISDLTGIEAFINMVQLQVRLNPIASIDVSQNAALQTIHCGSAELTTLTLGVNSALRNIQLSDAPNLTSVDVSGCADLLTFYLWNTAVTELVLMNHLLLEAIWVGQSPISSLDLSGCPSLIEVSVTSMDQLSSLNVANGSNTSFTSYDATLYGFQAQSCANLSCVEVDDQNYSTSTWTEVDPTISFSEDCSTFVGIDEAEGRSGMIYPNPVIDVVNIDAEFGSTFTIFDAVGRQMLYGVPSGRVDISALASGAYLLMNNEGRAQRFVKN